jgi:hypothetical protein
MHMTALGREHVFELSGPGIRATHTAPGHVARADGDDLGRGVIRAGDERQQTCDQKK